MRKPSNAPVTWPVSCRPSAISRGLKLSTDECWQFVSAPWAEAMRTRWPPPWTLPTRCGAKPIWRPLRRCIGRRPPSERVLGIEHTDTLTGLNNFAMLLKARGDLAGAEPELRRVLEVRERLHGGEHSDMLACIANLAGLLHHKGELTEAEPPFRRALTGCERAVGEEHPDTFATSPVSRKCCTPRAISRERSRYCAGRWVPAVFCAAAAPALYVHPISVVRECRCDRIVTTCHSLLHTLV